MRSVGWVIISAVGAAGTCAGVVAATVLSGGALIPVLGASMTLTGWGAVTGGTAGGIIGLITGAAIDSAVTPPGELPALLLEIRANDELKLDLLQVIVCVATCNAQKSFAVDAVRSAAVNEVFGLSAGFAHDELRKKIDAVLSSHYDEHLLNRALARLSPFRLTLHALSMACIRAVLVGSPALNEKQQSIVLRIDALASNSTDPVRV